MTNTVKPDDIEQRAWDAARRIAQADCGCAPGRWRANGTSHANSCWKHVQAFARVIMDARADQREVDARWHEKQAAEIEDGLEEVRRLGGWVDHVRRAQAEQHRVYAAAIHKGGE